MADGEKNKKSTEPSEERFKYIGFDVFPGKAGEIFSSDEERKSIVEKVKSKLARSHGEVRDRCTLMESRLSITEKLFLTLAAAAMIIGLFIPWFSGYIPVSYSELGSFGDHSFFFASKDDEAGIKDLANALKEKHDRQYASSLSGVSDEAPVEQQRPEEAAVEEPVDAVGEGEPVDSMAAGEPAVVEDENPDAQEEQPQPADDNADEEIVVPEEIKVIFVNTPDLDQIHGVNDLNNYTIARYTYNARTGRDNLIYGAGKVVDALPADMMTMAMVNDSISAAVTDSMKTAAMERIAEGDSAIVAVDDIFFAGPVLVAEKTVKELASKGVINDNYSITGIGALLSLGTYGSMIFSSGIVLVITGILFIVYFVSCLLLAGLNLYLLYGVKKKTRDEYDLYMKRMLRYNWVPIVIWLGMFLISFFGASYGFDSSGMLAQVGDSYNIVTFVGLSSFGIYVTLMGFLIAALKGKEI